MKNTMLNACLAVSFVAFLANPALAQSTGKNPADACKGMDKAGTAYANCVKAAAQAQQNQANKPADANANAQSDKKPGQTCTGMDKASKAYSDCVKAQAQTTKDTKPGANAAGKATGKPAKN